MTNVDDDGAPALEAVVSNLAELLPPFARHFVARGAPEDLRNLDASTTVGLAREALGLVVERGRSETGARAAPVVRVRDDAALGVTIVETVNDDRPFLVDSLTALLAERGHDVRVLLHPIYAAEWAGDGALTRIGAPGDLGEGAGRLSVIHVHIEPLSEAERAALAAEIDETMRQVLQATQDWRAMRERVDAAIRHWREAPPQGIDGGLDVTKVAEAAAFLEWLRDDNFILLGVREYTYDEALEPTVVGDGLGILRDPSVKVLRVNGELAITSPAIKASLAEPTPLFVTKANVRSQVHRRAHIDYVSVKRFEGGRLVGETRLIGLFTSSAYTQSVFTIPFVRRKAEGVIERLGFAPGSHSGKALQNVLETYPRDELFQTPVEELTPFALAAMQLEERPRTQVLARIDRFERFASILVYVPRERFSSRVRERIGEALAAAYGGRVSAFSPQFLEGRLVRVHFIIGGLEEGGARPSPKDLETQVADIVTSWSDRIRAALDETAGSDAAGLAKRYADAFSDAYQYTNGVSDALADIAKAESLGGGADEGSGDVAVALYRRDDMGAGEFGLRLYHLATPVPLSSRLPMLETMGLTAIAERTFELYRPQGEASVWLHDILLSSPAPLDMEADAPRLEAMFLAAWHDRAVPDRFNMLGLHGFEWREAALLRTLARYMVQGGSPFTPNFAARTLAAHPDLTRALFDLFLARNDPSLETRDPQVERAREAVQHGLADVPTIGEDRVLRRYWEVIEAIQRTNYFQTNEEGAHHAEIVVKIASPQLTWLPQPRPFVEAYLHAPDVDAVHLRGGKVARGGIRWSDRPQDFRTEVLGLAKAQQVKNAVIVPVGAKGGFVPRDADRSMGREAYQDAGRAAYSRFVTRMLEITDNLDGDTVIAPADVVRHDGDDPYFVVAADKGTATFSDTANAISQAHGYWLDDAFASGGSAGYDHKAMGITARGAWESVKRHFAEADIDIDKPFTVVGVGDMSGDVFGNGMVYVPTIKLLAAFDHRDIFLDPDPDPQTSFEERLRLFEMGRSSWKDYDTSLISEGGGVFSREMKAIPLSAQVSDMLGLVGDSAAPTEIMQAILKAKADLLWFGGIGTYIRAASESDGDVGDRANDAIRITGGQVRARVIGEGANLGLTQLGRIEAAEDGMEPGVRLNTDAIDNSGGVNSSDLEVNIKIALQTPEREGRLTREDRNVLLKEMTDEVAELVLANNARQALAISLAEAKGLAAWGDMRRLMQSLEARDMLKRDVEFLPWDPQVSARIKDGSPVTRPELAVLLAYAKIALYDDLLASEVPDDPYLSRELQRYFPSAMRERFAEAVESHRLRREIIATGLANAIINRGGPALVVQMQDRTGAAATDVAFAFAAVRDVYGLTLLNAEIDKLDTAVEGEVQLALYGAVQDLLNTEIVWFLRHGAGRQEGLDAIVARYGEGAAAYRTALLDALDEETSAALTAHEDELIAANVPMELARTVAMLPHMARATDVTLVATQANVGVAEATGVYAAIGRRAHLDALARMADALTPEDHYDRLALARTQERLEESQRRLTRTVIRTAGTGETAVDDWFAAHPDATRAVLAVEDILADGTASLSRVTVAAGFLADLAVADA